MAQFPPIHPRVAVEIPADPTPTYLIAGGLLLVIIGAIGVSAARPQSRLFPDAWKTRSSINFSIMVLTAGVAASVVGLCWAGRAKLLARRALIADQRALMADQRTLIADQDALMADQDAVAADLTRADPDFAQVRLRLANLQQAAEIQRARVANLSQRALTIGAD